MSKRGNPIAVAADMPKADPHEEKLSEMHDALYSLGDKIRKPYPHKGEKMLPKKLRSAEKPESKAARKHIDAMHAAMKGCGSE